MRLLVCGGRDFCDSDLVYRWLDVLNPSVVIQGESRGADQIAKDWAVSHDVELECYPADWAGRGLYAGPLRNAQMLEVGNPDLVLAFPGGRGTANMVRQARSAGVLVISVPCDE